MTYAACARTSFAALIDLPGATDIKVQLASEIDTSDRWFSFQVSQQDFEAIVRSVAREHHGPTEITWAESVTVPAQWAPEHTPPDWWQVTPAISDQAVWWCHAAVPTYHHGWYFYRNDETGRALCWFWSYQHADEMCDDSTQGGSRH